MLFYPVTLTCTKCETVFPASTTAFNAVGDLRFEGSCPHCQLKNSWETTYKGMIYACQQREITIAENKALALAKDPGALAEVIVTTRPC